MNRQKNIESLKKMTGVAVFAALAYLSMIVLRIPDIGGFLTMDFKDVIITVSAMFFGPLSAVFISVLVPFLEFMTISGTGVYGLIMNILSSLTFSLTASLIYKYKKTFWGAVIGLLSATCTVVAVMMVANLVITPYYMKMPTSAVAALIPKLLLPFNLTKAIFNSAVTLILYKPLTSVMRKTDFFGKKRACPKVEKTPEEKKKEKIRTVLLWTVGIAVAVVSMLVIILIWNGRISFFDVRWEWRNIFADAFKSGK